MAIVIQLAGEAFGWLEQATRENGDSFVRTRDGTPEWITDMIHEAHGDMLPDDFCYATIYDLLSSMVDYDDLEDAASEIIDSGVSVYTSQLTALAGI